MDTKQTTEILSGLNLTPLQRIAYNDFCARCIRAGMSKIPAIITLRSAHAAITGKPMSLRTAKAIIDHGYQVRTTQIVTEALPRALREQSVEVIASLHAQYALLSRLGIDA